MKISKLCTWALVAFALCSSGLSFGNIRSQVISEEIPLNPQFSIQYRLSVDQEGVGSQPQMQLPNGLTLVSFTQSHASDVVTCTAVVSCDTSSLPFYLQKIYFTYPHQTLIAAVYFTPSNTIEVFDDLGSTTDMRIWLTPSEFDDTTRQFIAKENLPQSHFTEAEFEELRSSDYVLVSAPGLAYSVPQRIDAVRQTSIIDNGKTAQKLFEIDLMRTYQGTVKGRLVREVDGRIEPLYGIRVELNEIDFGIWFFWKSTYTDENGYFEIPYSKQQFLENSRIELGLVFNDRNFPHNVELSGNQFEHKKIGKHGQGSSNYVANAGDIYLGNKMYVLNNICRGYLAAKEWSIVRDVNTDYKAKIELGDYTHSYYSERSFLRDNPRYFISNDDINNKDIQFRAVSHMLLISKDENIDLGRLNRDSDQSIRFKQKTEQAFYGGLADFLAYVMDTRFYAMDQERGRFMWRHLIEPSSIENIPNNQRGCLLETSFADALE